MEFSGFQTGFETLKNREVAAILNKIGDILKFKGVEWKPQAYKKAARTIETMPEPIEEIYKKEGLKGLDKIPGVGKAIAQHIAEYLKTGKIKKYDKLLKTIPKGVEEMMRIQGMGPKKALKLYKKLGIKNVKELEKAAKKGKLKKLTGMGERTEKDILRGIKITKSVRGRNVISVAMENARQVVNELKKVPGVKRLEIAGSLRRMKETIRDIDLLMLSSKPSKAINAFVKLPQRKHTLMKGPTKSTIVLKEGIQVDLRVVGEKEFGSALLYFTGSKDHNIHLRKIAMRKKYKLSEYGLFKGKKFLCGKTEKEVYSKLGFGWIPPELREDMGELDVKKLPVLLPYKAVKGDLQIHTKWSDGDNTISEMALKAEKMGYKYIAITDHSKSQHQAHGMKEKRLFSYLKEIEKVQKKRRIRILKGCEVDILSDGSLDFSNKILKKLDYVLGGVHSGFKSSKQKMTARLLKAMDNPYLNTIAHPTGRKIGKRPSYLVDLDKVFEKAKSRRISMEIDAFPDRLDLNDVKIKRGLSFGVKFALGTDSHNVDSLRFMEYGIGQARRGWATTKDIINTKSYTQLMKYLKR